MDNFSKKKYIQGPLEVEPNRHFEVQLVESVEDCMISMWDSMNSFSVATNLAILRFYVIKNITKYHFLAPGTTGCVCIKLTDKSKKILDKIFINIGKVSMSSITSSLQITPSWNSNFKKQNEIQSSESREYQRNTQLKMIVNKLNEIFGPNSFLHQGEKDNVMIQNILDSNRNWKII
jgi:hypothetical protein